MPSGKQFNRHEQKWEKIAKERPNEYDANVTLAGALLLTYWRLYPDRYMAFCEADKPEHRLVPIQCMFLRAELRYEDVFITGGRALTKSYTGMGSRIVMGNLYPATVMPYYGPSLKQTAKIAAEAFDAIARNYPLLVDGWVIDHKTEAKFEAHNQSGSRIIVGVMRGDNAHCVFNEEVAQQEDGEQFDHEKYKNVVRKAIREVRSVNEKKDPMFPMYQKVYVTSANDQENPSFEYRKEVMKQAALGLSAIAFDVPGDVGVLNGIKTLKWYLGEQRGSSNMPDKWLTEMCARWTGSSENPVIRSSTLSESKSILVMENRHCNDPKVIYVIGYDVSATTNKKSAKCATVVLKLERQNGEYNKDRYLKSVVYIANEDASESIRQARILKDRWFQFTHEGASPTYIAIDARNYGQNVYENLHHDMNDALPTLCSHDHEKPDLEEISALPIIYPIRAVGGYADPLDFSKDCETNMVRYAEQEWEHRNIKLLVTNITEGVQAYKRYYRIKDDLGDSAIAIPYWNTRTLASQITNLRKKPSGSGFTVEMNTRSLQKDVWSALEYALRCAQWLEYQNLAKNGQRENEWGTFFKTGEISPARNNSPYAIPSGGFGQTNNARVIERSGGNKRWQ